jgi:polar amino acid transport system substrate-binding protein
LTPNADTTHCPIISSTADVRIGSNQIAQRISSYACPEFGYNIRVMAELTISFEIAPRGKLRCAAIAIRALAGVGEPIGKFIADRLSVPLKFIRYRNPDAYAESFGKEEWDIAIGPRVLAPADMADVLSDLWLVDLLYLAAPRHRFASTDQVDRPGVKVSTIQNSPSDRFLTRTLKSAELVRLPLSANFPTDLIEMLRTGKADLFGGDFGLIDWVVGAYPEANIVPGILHTVRVALTLPKGRSSAALTSLEGIIKDVKRTGAIQKAFEQAGLKNGIRVAPE